ncbi:MAG TPA: glycosyltransferase, partial [Vicinamibacteria bacterium]
AVRAAYPTAETYRFYGTQHSASQSRPHEFMGVLNRFLAGDRMVTATAPAPLTVVFIPLLTETGHLNPTLGLARDLARRGHRPVYLAMPELLAQAVKQGFSGSPLFPDLPQQAPPAGWLLSLPLLRAMREIRTKTRHFNVMMDRMLSGRVAAELHALKPDVVAVDNMWPQLAFVARRAGIPSVLLSTTPEFRADDARRCTVGTGTRVREWLLRTMFFILGLRWHQKTRRLARECTIDSVDLKGPMPRLAGHEIPELLLYPREIDDPSANPGRYVGPVIDVDRREPPLDLANIPAGETLVYCALGSRQTSARRALALFRLIIAAVARRPAHTLILAAGEHAASLRDVPDHVRVVDKAPQLAVLSRADVMLTHGGLGSIKESLYFGVPMLVFPLRFDQEANARRVHDRGLGVHIGRRDRTVEGIGRALDEIAANPAYRERVKAVSDAMRALQSKAEATDFFTSLAAHPDRIHSAAKV